MGPIKYNQKNLDDALDDIRKGLSFGKASKKHGIPKSTLVTKATGKRRPWIGRVGTNRILLDEEEKELCNYIRESSRKGLNMNDAMVKDAVKELLNLSGRTVKRVKNNKPGKRWWKDFLKRNSDIRKYLTKSITPHFEKNQELVAFIPPPTPIFSEVARGLEGLEKTFSKDKALLFETYYRQGLESNNPLYIAWKTLHMAVEKEEN